MTDTCLEKQQQLAALFASCDTQEKTYMKLMELGRSLPTFAPEFKTEEALVSGCQSQMYLRSYLEGEKVRFEVASDALISAGLAACLIKIYDGESPETILKCPPEVFKTLDLSASLTPSRANGLYHIHLKMKQEALKYLLHAT